MSVVITIQGSPIQFPTSGDSPNWAPAVTEFAQLVEQAIATTAGAFDVAPQVFDIASYNSASTVSIPNLSFSTAEVRSATITIACFRENTTPANTTVYEHAELFVVYNPNGSTNEKWEISRMRTGNASIVYSMTDDGQVQFTTTSIGSGTHSGTLSYSAKAQLQTS